jgi:hypothetical protein
MASPYFAEEGVPGRVVRVRFSESAYRTMLQLAGAERSTMAAVMREALSVYSWLAREQSQGNLFLVRRGEVVTELRIPSLEGMDPLPPQCGAEGQPPVEEPGGAWHVVAEVSNGRGATS